MILQNRPQPVSKGSLLALLSFMLLSGGLSASLAMPEVQASEHAFQVYEMQYCINRATGQVIFCGDCFTEGLDCACLPE